MDIGELIHNIFLRDLLSKLTAEEARGGWRCAADSLDWAEFYFNTAGQHLLALRMASRGDKLEVSIRSYSHSIIGVPFTMSEPGFDPDKLTDVIASTLRRLASRKALSEPGFDLNLTEPLRKYWENYRNEHSSSTRL